MIWVKTVTWIMSKASVWLQRCLQMEGGGFCFFGGGSSYVLKSDIKVNLRPNLGTQMFLREETPSKNRPDLKCAQPN